MTESYESGFRDASASLGVDPAELVKRAFNWRDHAANAVDWYINRLNTAHLIPANAAMLARSVNAKQLGSANFVPRPVTAANYTDAEAATILRLAMSGKDGGYKNITDPSYVRLGTEYGKEDQLVNRYFSPIEVVGKSIGQAVVRPEGGDHVLHDAYDFNRSDAHYTPLQAYKDKMESGQRISPQLKGEITGNTPWKHRHPWDEDSGQAPDISDKYVIGGGQVVDKAGLEKLRYDRMKAFNGSRDFYTRLRGNAARYAQSDADPDANKIKVRISMKELEDRVRRSKEGFAANIFKAPTTRELVNKATLAGGLTGAAGGAALGLAGGGLALLLSRNRRRKWLQTLAAGGLLGAGVLGAAGALGARTLAGGIAQRANQITKKSAAVDERERKKRTNPLYTALKAVALTGLAGGAVYGAGKLGIRYAGKGLDKINRTLLGDYDSKFDTVLVQDKLPEGDLT